MQSHPVKNSITKYQHPIKTPEKANAASLKHSEYSEQANQASFSGSELSERANQASFSGSEYYERAIEPDRDNRGFRMFKHDECGFKIGF